MVGLLRSRRDGSLRGFNRCFHFAVNGAVHGPGVLKQTLGRDQGLKHLWSRLNDWSVTFAACRNFVGFASFDADQIIIGVESVRVRRGGPRTRSMCPAHSPPSWPEAEERERPSALERAARFSMI